MAGSLASLIDHTLLKPEATAADARRYCDEARQHGFASVCVNPVFVAAVARALDGSLVRACSVVAFPFGATTTHAKMSETRRAVADGATEIDMVMTLADARAGDWVRVRDDIAAVREACGAAALKVIIEACFLTDAQKAAACEAAVTAGAAFVKTSTGYGSGGATVADVALMRDVVGPSVGVKASGGIRTAATAWQMIEAGANRIGTSNGIALLGD